MVTCPEPPRWLGAGIQSQRYSAPRLVLVLGLVTYSHRSHAAA